MITADFCFTYTEEDWNAIKVEFRTTLDLDADQIELDGNRFAELLDELGVDAATRSSFGDLLRPRTRLRTRIECAAAMYASDLSYTRQSPRRAELVALRKHTKNLRTCIYDALAQRVRTPFDDFMPEAPKVYVMRGDVDPIMALSTHRYFTKLLSTLDRQIEQAGKQRDNARKAARDNCWNKLLEIWCDLGGKPSGAATARFLRAASKPVMGSAVPTLTSVVQWLYRRQNKTVRTVAKPRQVA
jgi:hypothetical protein